MRSKIQPTMIVIRANFQFKFNRNVEVTYARTLEKRCFLCVFSTSPPTVPSTKPSNCAKMAYNLLSNMMLYFIKCTHFSYRYSYMSNIHQHNFSNDLIRSLIPFDHPFSKCGHLKVTHYGIKIHMLTDDI